MNQKQTVSLEIVLKGIKPIDEEAVKAAKAHWDRVAKPLNSLGVLEEDICRVAGVKQREEFSLDKKCIVIMCADNGIVEEGVTQTGQEVTAAVAKNMAARRSCVCLMAACAGAEVLPVDVGIAAHMSETGILDRKIAWGTKDFLKEPAMTREDTVKALEVGIEAAGILYEKGCDLAGTGEMGIGNTTTSSAVISVLTGLDPETVTGKGAGLDNAGLKRKIEVIKEGIRIHKPDPSDGIDVLSKVGGLDLAALAGFYLGCAYWRIPVVLDGLITGAAALAAVKICPEVAGYLLASHLSAEPAGQAVLSCLGLKAAIQAGMCLGEGTGAAAFFPMLDMALTVYSKMDTFQDIKVKPYCHFEEDVLSESFCT